MKKQKNIAIIPARGGSKRLPGKNIMPLLGKPLIAYSIDFAKDNYDFLDEIVVSTDDPDIKRIALQLDVKVLDRPASLSGDMVTTAEVLAHTVKQMDNDFDNVVLLQATNPLRPQNLLREAFFEFYKGDHDSLMTVSRNHQKFGTIVEGSFVPYNYEFGQRSQDLEPLYFENGLLYITKRSLIEKGMIMGDHMLPFIVNHPFASVDIDDREDLELAEYFLQKQRLGQIG